jgi:hypothetical protein
MNVTFIQHGDCILHQGNSSQLSACSPLSPGNSNNDARNCVEHVCCRSMRVSLRFLNDTTRVVLENNMSVNSAWFLIKSLSAYSSRR